MSRVINLQGGGKAEGLSALIRVNAETGSTVSCNGVQGVEHSGVWDFPVSANLVPNPSYRNLPSGYKQLDYIESTGSQYINSGYKISSNHAKIVMDFQLTTLPSDSYAFGSVYTSSPYNGFWLRWDNNKFGGAAGNDGQFLQVTSGYDTNRNDASYEANNGTATLTVNGSTVTRSYSGSLITNTNWYLFARNYDSSYLYAQIKLYAFELYDNGVKVRDYVPCIRISDNAIGLYDVVNATFTASATGTPFVAGEETSPMVYRTYTVTATKGSKSASQVVQVDYVGLYEVTLLYSIDTDFSSQGNWREVGGTFSYTSSGIQFAVGSETGTQTFMSGFSGQYIEHDISLNEWDMTLTNNVYGTNAQYGGIAVQLVDSSNNPIVSIYRGDGYGGTSNYNYFKLFDSSFSQLQYTQVSGINNVSLTMSMTYHSGTLVAKYNSTQIYSASHTLNDVAKVRVWFIHETGYSNPLEVASHLIVE